VTTYNLGAKRGLATALTGTLLTYIREMMLKCFALALALLVTLTAWWIVNLPMLEVYARGTPLHGLVNAAQLHFDIECDMQCSLQESLMDILFGQAFIMHPARDYFCLLVLQSFGVLAIVLWRLRSATAPDSRER
jgi:hypothetical protein